MSLDLDRRVADFEAHLLAPEAGVYDPPELHHEFTQGLHGRKVDFDHVREGSPLYAEWVDITARSLYDDIPTSLLGRTVLIGVASRTNPFVHDVAEEVGHELRAIETIKNDQGLPELSPEAIERLQAINPLVSEIEEDAITRGTNTSSVAVSVHLNRPPRLRLIKVRGTFQRGIPERLLELGVPYQSIIKKLMHDYEPEDCRDHGLCAAGSKLIPYKRKAA